MDLNLVSNTNIMDTTWSCEFCEKPGPTAEKALLEYPGKNLEMDAIQSTYIPPLLSGYIDA
jgi:hypothetical protein